MPVRLRHRRRGDAARRRPLAEPGTDGVDLVAEVTTAEPYTRRRRAAAGRGLRLRDQARPSCATSAGMATVEVVPAATPAAEVLARRPDGVFLSNGPGRPGRGRRTPSTPSPSLLGRGAGLRHLPRPPAAGHAPSAARPTSCRSATTAATIRCAAWPPARSRSPARTTTTPWPTARVAGADVTHVNLNDGVIEGLPLPRRAGLQRAVPPRGRARAPRRPLPLRASSARLMDAGRLRRR